PTETTTASTQNDEIYLNFNNIKCCLEQRQQTFRLLRRQTLSSNLLRTTIHHYKYSMIKNDFCFCGNYLGVEVTKNVTCDCPSCPDSKANLTDVYLTGNLVPGPPENVQLTNITDISVHISWEVPKSYTEISSYLIQATVNHTYVNYIPNNPVWKYLNDTFGTTLIVLPATRYNITLRAISPDGPGAMFSKVIETQVGDPENLPDPPKIIKKYGNKIEIKLSEISNSNGPITSYLVVVLNEDSGQIFQDQLLKSYSEAKNDGTSYYIAAELKPESIKNNFIVGDGNYYGKYYNAPLESNVNYKIISGIISSLNGQTKRAFSNSDNSINSLKEIIDEDSEEMDGDSPAVVIGLSIAIGLLSFMLVAGVIGFIILKSRENNGYIPEEEHSKLNYYKNLKQKVTTIPYNQLKIEPTNLLGIGRFGRVNSGSVYENNTLIPVAAYSIQDKKLSPEDKKNMLRDLDLLIKTGKHDNIIALIGTCETSQIVLVVLEYVSMNLKDLLLGSRDSLPGRFSNMTENQALDIAINVSKGMAHLESNRTGMFQIVHRQLCARNVMVANGFVPKISGYGLAQFYSHNNLPDYTRWTALEVFKGQSHNLKSDVWSFACLLWEICVLGGTPYGNFSNNEIPERVTKGLRLPQMQYFSDELYQIMLNCWQYEQFYPDMEVAVRPVF
ncbi:tyrosine-protein kinase Wsck, partial [Asbolus verrucosus]